MRELIELVKEWGVNKGITHNDNDANFMRTKQADKTQEELDELFEAIVAGDREEAEDAIGDIIVTLIMQAEWWDLEIEDCLQAAYDVISKRTGKMVNGQFVKESK